MFEDPDGTRLLYDAGRTVRGAHDPRLSEIDAVLLSHVHGDHLGDAHQSGPSAGSCAEPDSAVADTPNSKSVNIVVAKQASFLVGGERQVGGVRVASVPAVRSNGIDPEFRNGDFDGEQTLASR